MYILDLSFLSRSLTYTGYGNAGQRADQNLAVYLGTASDLR